MFDQDWINDAPDRRRGWKHREAIRAARTDGARLALEAAVEWLRAHGHHDLAASMSGDVMLAGALTPEDIVRDAAAKEVDR